VADCRARRPIKQQPIPSVKHRPPVSPAIACGRDRRHRSYAACRGRPTARNHSRPQSPGASAGSRGWSASLRAHTGIGAVIASTAGLSEMAGTTRARDRAQPTRNHRCRPQSTATVACLLPAMRPSRRSLARCKSRPAGKSSWTPTSRYPGCGDSWRKKQKQPSATATFRGMRSLPSQTPPPPLLLLFVDQNVIAGKTRRPNPRPGRVRSTRSTTVGHDLTIRTPSDVEMLGGNDQGFCRA